MTPNEYQAQAKTTFLGHMPDPLAYLSFGLGGETGEILEKIKKYYRGDYELDTEKKEMLKKELGDVLWYTSVLADHLGFELEDVMQANLDKLASRKQRNVLQGDGDNR
jgi:NTP pyrophosphatase (non-canonical NTP hydrolase)